MESRSRRMTMRRGSSVLTMALLGLVLLTSLDTVRGIPYRRSLLKLCSKNLSDAVRLVCGDRGYNEPSSNTGDDSFSSGPGLAEECCQNTCTMSQIRQYCKPEPDAVKDSSWILNIHFPPIVGEGASDSEEESEKERSRSRSRSRLRSTGAPKSQSGSYTDIDNVSGELKCKSDRSSRARNHGINNARVEDGDEGVSDGQSDLRRKSTYPRRQMRRPPGKVLPPNAPYNLFSSLTRLFSIFQLFSCRFSYSPSLPVLPCLIYYSFVPRRFTTARYINTTFSTVSLTL